MDWHAVARTLASRPALTAVRLSHPLPAPPSDPSDTPTEAAPDPEAALTALRRNGIAVDASAWIHMSEGGFRPRPWGVMASEAAARGAQLVPQAQLEFEAERQDKVALQESVESSTFSQGEARRAVDALQTRTAALQRELEGARAATAEAERQAQEVCARCGACSS